MKKSYKEKLIARYRQGNATRAEKYILERWYDSFDHDSKDPYWLEDPTAIKRFENRVLNSVRQRSISVHWNNWWLRAAVILLICSISAYLGLRRQDAAPKTIFAFREFSTGVGQMKQIILTDSTSVFLNANSRLAVSETFGEKERTVRLSGEAFFRVKKDRTRPFIVHTTGLDIRVLGTAFNINSYLSLDRIQVGVSHGRVRVSHADRPIAELVAQEQLSFKRSTGTYERSTIAISDNPAWISGKVTLDRAGFDELAQVFSNFYGLEVTSSDHDVLEGRYNITLYRDRNVQQSLAQLCTLIDKHYKKEGTKKIIIYK